MESSSTTIDNTPLRRVESLPGRGAPVGRSEPFALVLQGGSARLESATYRVEHARLGTFELFLVPVGRGEREAVYEAIFG